MVDVLTVLLPRHFRGPWEEGPCEGAGTYSTPLSMLVSTKASMRTVPTASKKFGWSGLASESGRVSLFVDAVPKSVRSDEPLVEPGCNRDEVDEGTALEEELRKLLNGAGSLGLVLLRLR